jgi:hypothetical protein
MADAVFESIEETLTQVESSLKRHVETASALIREVELADELIRSGREQVALARTTLTKTRELKRLVNEQRKTLAVLRATLGKISG